MTRENYNDESIDFRKLYKNVISICKNKKSRFLILFFIIMGLASTYFVKTIIKPKYESHTLIKSNLVNTNQFQLYSDFFNEAIGNEYQDQPIPEKIQTYFKESDVRNIEFKQLKPSMNDPKKGELMTNYNMIVSFGKKPNISKINNLDFLLDFIKTEESKQNSIIESKKRVEDAITEVDSLIKVAFVAGDEFKKKMNSNSGSMLVISDLYKSVNDIIATKKSLEAELFQYKTENLVYQTSPYVVSKKMKYPFVVLIAGLFFWIGICLIWIIGSLVFGAED